MNHAQEDQTERAGNYLAGMTHAKALSNQGGTEKLGQVKMKQLR